MFIVMTSDEWNKFLEEKKAAMDAVRRQEEELGGLKIQFEMSQRDLDTKNEKIKNLMTAQLNLNSNYEKLKEENDRITLRCNQNAGEVRELRQIKSELESKFHRANETVEACRKYMDDLEKKLQPLIRFWNKSHKPKWIFNGIDLLQKGTK